MDKISIIIPVYGVEKYIVKCIESIVNQTYKNLEIIIINDGTKDNSIKLVEDNFNDKRIKIYNRKNEGQASARNFGIKQATGKYIMFIDSDDFVDINMIKDMYDVMTKEKSNLVICDYYKYYNENNKEAIKIIPFYDKKNSKCSVISMPGPVCKLFKKEIFDKYDITFLEHKCFEDNAIMPFACAVSGKFSYINKPYYYYVQREGSSLNKQKYDRQWEDIFDSLENLYQKFASYKMLDEYYQELEYIYIEYLLHAANLKFLPYNEGRKNIPKVAKTLKTKFPSWRKNKYYKQENIKYKVMCNLFYYNQIWLINILRRK